MRIWARSGLAAVVAAAVAGSISVAAPGASSPPTGSSMLCGLSWQPELNSERSHADALPRVDGYYGGLDLTRVFYSVRENPVASKLPGDTRPTHVSIQRAPKEVIAGEHDAMFRQFFRSIPNDQTVYWTYFHEPEDNTESKPGRPPAQFTPEQFREAWKVIWNIAEEEAGDRSKLHATLTLMGWTLDPRSGRDFTDFYPGDKYVDVLGWDVYNGGWNTKQKEDLKVGTYVPPAETFGPVVRKSSELGKRFAIPETGTPLMADDVDGSRRAAWLQDSIAYLDRWGAEYIAYFDLDWTKTHVADYRMMFDGRPDVKSKSDVKSGQVWREFCSR